MPVYFQKKWHTGDSRWDETNKECEEQWPKPLYRPKFWVSYTKIVNNVPKNRKGCIIYAHRRLIDSVTFYFIQRANGNYDVVAEVEIKERIEPQEMKDFE